jgi:hypothetical protein
MSVLSKFDAYRVAGEARCDPRTVASYVSGARTPAPVVKQAIDRALAKLGLSKHKPAEVRP